MPSQTYELLKNAIIGRQQVVCTHGGHVREVCPHVIGYKNKREQVLAYQFAGGSTTSLPPGGQWRCFAIKDLSNVSVRPGPWHTGTGHSRPQTCVDDIDVQVDF